MLTVYFYGSLQSRHQLFIGGGELGNARTVDLLRQIGCKVWTVRKIRMGNTCPRWLRIFTYPLRVLMPYVRLVPLLLFGTRKAIVHLSGVCGNVIYNELVIAFLARIFGYHLIYEIRGGGIVMFYNSKSTIYRFCFRYIINHADVVLLQGSDGKTLVEGLCRTPIYIYPNFISSELIPAQLPAKSRDDWQMLYFGRLIPQKNILLIVEVVAALQKKGINTYITIVGDGTPSYIGKIKTAMETYLRRGTYNLMPPLSHNEMLKILPDKHFLIYPSMLTLEGHSNSITEAMSYGIVPIASRQGFSTSVIGNNELIVDNIGVENFADRIAAIIESGKFDQLSRQMYERVLKNYTSDVAKKMLVSVYQTIVGA